MKSRPRISIMETKALTLIEMVISMSLLLIMFMGALQAIAFIDRCARRHEREADVIQDMNLALLRISRDVRGALRPNNVLDAVDVDPPPPAVPGRWMDVYIEDPNPASGLMIRVEYRILADADGVEHLQRQEVFSNEAAFPYFVGPPGRVGPLEVLISDLQTVEPDGTPIMVFDDVTPGGGERRLVAIDIRNNEVSFEIRTQFFSRSRRP